MTFRTSNRRCSRRRFPLQFRSVHRRLMVRVPMVAPFVDHDTRVGAPRRIRGLRHATEVHRVDVDLSVALAIVTLTIVVTLLCGAVPAWHAARQDFTRSFGPRRVPVLVHRASAVRWWLHSSPSRVPCSSEPACWGEACPRSCTKTTDFDRPAGGLPRS